MYCMLVNYMNTMNTLKATYEMNLDFVFTTEQGWKKTQQPQIPSKRNKGSQNEVL